MVDALKKMIGLTEKVEPTAKFDSEAETPYVQAHYFVR